MIAIDFVIQFISILSTVLTFAVLIRALMSWFMPAGVGGVMVILQEITEPILAPIRRVLPPIAGIDLSPLVAMILIPLISRLLIGLIVASA